MIERRVGRLLGANSRAARPFDVRAEASPAGSAQLPWSKTESWREWARRSEDCQVLRSNVTGWTAEERCRAYIQLAEAEAAFRVQKSDLEIRPVWHQRQDHVEAHILVCFLAYVLWKVWAAMCRHAGLGPEPHQGFEALSEIVWVDVILPTRNGTVLRKRGISQLAEHQPILLQHLRMNLPVLEPTPT